VSGPVLSSYTKTLIAVEMNSDEAILSSLGYKQDFKRAYTRLELFGLSFTIVSVLPSIAGVLIFAIPNGGPVALVWGWAVCSPFIMAICLAIAEYGSAAPTSGGLYYWTYRYAPPNWKKVLSWLVGYTNSIAYMAGVTSIDWATAVSLLAGVSIGTDFRYIPTTAHTFGCFVALVIIHTIIASSSTAAVARMQGVFIAFNILLPLGLIIALPVATPKEFMNSAKYAFGGFENFTTWPNGFAFFLSFLSPLWTIGAFDSPCHISEEASNAPFAVPFATISSPLVACILGWAINVVIAFCMGTDLDSIVNNQIGQPFATILFNSFGKKGALAVWSIIIATQFSMGVCSLTASSRLIWAFSRDGAFPFSSIIYKINPVTRTPIYAVIASSIVAILVGCLAFAGPQAISAIFSACVVGQYIALSISIMSRHLPGSEVQAWKPGPFTLGRWSYAICLTAVIFMNFVSVIFMFPSNPNPDAKTMNWTVIVIGGWVFMCLVYYYFPKYGGVHWFNGPVANVEFKSMLNGSEDGIGEKSDVDVEVKSAE